MYATLLFLLLARSTAPVHFILTYKTLTATTIGRKALISALFRILPCCVHYSEHRPNARFFYRSRVNFNCQFHGIPVNATYFHVLLSFK